MTDLLRVEVEGRGGFGAWYVVSTFDLGHDAREHRMEQGPYATRGQAVRAARREVKLRNTAPVRDRETIWEAGA